jgi:hypothetical protein
MTFHEGPDPSVTLAFAQQDVGQCQQWAEWFVGLIVSRLRILGGDPGARPAHVKFQHDADPRGSRLAGLLGCAPEFGCTRTSVGVDPGILGVRVPNASAFLRGIVLRHAEADLERVAPRDRFTARAKRAVADMLAHEEVPRISSLARRAHCSVRTVQARLAGTIGNISREVY